MAQPVYNEHPLEEYLRQSGEGDRMPGVPLEFAPTDEEEVAEEQEGEILDWLPPGVRQIFDVLRSFTHSHRIVERRRELVEHFKYDVISSTLLSTTLATSAHGRRPATPDIPGHLRTHSREPSLTHSHSAEPPPKGPPLARAGFTEEQIQHWALVLTCTASFAGAFRFYLFAVLLLFAAAYPYVFTEPAIKQDNMAAALDALGELTTAGNLWDSVVHEAITVLEAEEKSVFYGPTSASSPTASLRIALNSSLQSTRAQCEKVRALFAALTSPSDLSQLSEMYAPTSPGPSGLSPSHATTATSRRPRTLSTPIDPPPRGAKRATWNGSYTTGSPTMKALRWRGKRHSDVAVLMRGHGHGGSHSWASTSSAPVTPDPHANITGVQDEPGVCISAAELASTSAPEYFGAQVMDLRRDRRKHGIESLLTTPPRRGLGFVDGPSFASSSRLTALPTSRHPLSLSALHHSLHGALAAKRYSCSHLLALRFEDELGDDSDYWDDVQSVMALLASALADASSCLVEALDETERKRAEDQVPSESAHSRRASLTSNSAEEGPGVPDDVPLVDDPEATVGRRKGRTMQQMVGFAPMPSHVVRFAAHVDAISSALDSAREHLEETVAALRGEEAPPTPDGSSDSGSINRPQDSPALMTYERLRRELGFALRECERGRERLLDIIAASQPQPEEESEGEEEPALAPDMGSEGSSEKFPSVDLRNTSPRSRDYALLEDTPGDPAVAHPEDDASRHLQLMSSAQHLPPPGIEQVFEGESVTPVLTRERSKLSREERIRLAKQRREQGVGGSISSTEGGGERKGGERWGPGGDVVQELKDVIWKVGERRRKIARQASEDRTSIPTQPASSFPSPGDGRHGDAQVPV